MSEVAWMDTQDDEEEEDSGFVVLDDASADWCLRKIRENQADLETWEDYYSRQLAKMRKKVEESNARLLARLRDYYEMVPHKKTKTGENYPLPSGKLVIKKHQVSYQADDEKLVPWLKVNHPDLVKTRETANWAELKKLLPKDDNGIVKTIGNSAVDENGEIVPGVTVTPLPDEFKIEAKK